MTKRANVAAVVLAIVAVAFGCERKAERRAPTPLDRATLGSITGEVRFDGTPPPSTKVDMASAKDCAAGHAGPVDAGDVLVEGGKVQNAIVAIKDGLGDRVFAVSETPVVIDQQGCLFVPRVAAAQADQPVKFLNSDTFPHNVHGTPPESSGWNFSLGLKGASRTVDVDDGRQVIPIKCDIHPWMHAFLVVYPHPYFAVTAAAGRFAL